MNEPIYGLTPFRGIRAFVAIGGPLDAVWILIIAAAIIGVSILLLILVLCGYRFRILKWCGWGLIAVAILWGYSCYFQLGNFTTPEPSAIFEPTIPLGAGVIIAYLLRRCRNG
jgi:hypothetical protein